jgi:hypothetical protein
LQPIQVPDSYARLYQPYGKLSKEGQHTKYRNYTKAVNLHFLEFILFKFFCSKHVSVFLLRIEA